MPGKIARIEIDAKKCIGSDACVAVAPKTFALDPKSNVAYVIDPNGDTEEYIMIAAVDCPPAAISLYTESGDEIELELPTKVPEERAK